MLTIHHKSHGQMDVNRLEDLVLKRLFRLVLLLSSPGPDFDHMSSFFPCKIDDAIQYINLGYGTQAPKIVIL